MPPRSSSRASFYNACAPRDRRLAAELWLWERERHAVERAAERYGLEVTPLTLRQIADAIEAGSCGVIRRDGRGVECEVLMGQAGVTLSTVRVRVIYLTGPRAVATFLPPLAPSALPAPPPLRRDPLRLSPAQRRRRNINRDRRRARQAARQAKVCLPAGGHAL